MYFKNNKGMDVSPLMRNKHTYPNNQDGVAVMGLVVVLLVVLTIVGINSSKTSTLELKMSTNSTEHQKAKLAAESAIYHAWKKVNDQLDFKKYVSNCAESGVFDLRTNAEATTCTQDNKTKSSKNSGTWANITSSKDWEWENSDTNESLPNSLTVSSVPFLSSNEMENPMKIAKAPQFATGIHEPILLKGTENYYCIPVSIIAAGTGSSENSSVLIEVKSIPRSGCFRKMY
ncbi:MAG: Unknown protein [uncultured Thiotrichaceae bacterium]|uniref:Type 4 fimbrial biogenesis protein PilX N-terminal domain-containing protein n=1 Tax=uncultured Thiotrichaceae bacterium TaxID=298394 RepID=A0A6S6S2N3_9GAMM|nr:MAG: Unknown protein [uncultured Thiotrichaceae bacterium]